MKEVIVDFHGIDSWNRPVFKSVNGNYFYGSTDILFEYGESREKVLQEVVESNLVYFGTKFDCEPSGSACPFIKIKREE